MIIKLELPSTMALVNRAVKKTGAPRGVHTLKGSVRTVGFMKQKPNGHQRLRKRDNPHQVAQEKYYTSSKGNFLCAMGALHLGHAHGVHATPKL